MTNLMDTVKHQNNMNQTVKLPSKTQHYIKKSQLLHDTKNAQTN